MKYFDLVVDNKADKTDRLYTYGTEDDNICVGSRVRVPFARGNRELDAYVISEAKTPEDDMISKIKEIISIDQDVSLTEEMIATAGWLKKRYLCRYIDAIKLFAPVGSKAKRRKEKNIITASKACEEYEINLTQEQANALGQIESSIDMGLIDRFLLHGVTGSGKTEVYLRAAKAAIDKGKTVIVLVPEIALTGQIVERFAARFGNEILAIIHSRLTQGERYDQWQRIRNGQVKIVIGARSAVFAPLSDIGLIILDEEHESTYKSDFTPKYDTVEVALKRAGDKRNRGVLLLGSATPSIVTFSRAREGIYKIIELKERYNKVPLPQVSIVDMREELKNGNKSIISQKLYDYMQKSLESGKQIMLFLNRRGYSTFLSCRECGHVIKCPGCGLSLKYHKHNRSAKCHYCGHIERAPDICPECGSRYIKYFGVGTEKLQEAVEELFSEYEVDRLDLDTIKTKGELNKKLKKFKRKETDILIGTQIIAKGLDFRNVGLVGIISADVSLNIPDFRSPERTFQLITQAAGRAGRGDEMGQVVIQTYSPDNYAIKFAADQNYEDFYKQEINLRSVLKYPPYSDLYQIIVTSETKEAAMEGAMFWHKEMLSKLPEIERKNVFYPQEAYISKIKNIYRYSVLIKCPKGKRNQYSAVMEEIRQAEKEKSKKLYTAVIDINPYSFS